MRTPGPVEIDSEGVIFSRYAGVNICSMYPFNRIANAQFIVTAWNCHDDLVAALGDVIATLDWEDPYGATGMSKEERIADMRVMVEQALALVKSQEAPG